MRIAQIAPLFESVPPKKYGGTERVVSYLTEELVKRGHQVTLFASGDSITSAELVAITPQSLREAKNCEDPLAHHILMLDKVFSRAEEFDILHFHIDYLHFPLSKRQWVPHVTTLHGRLDIPDLLPLYEGFKDMPLVSISRAQRAPLSFVHWVDNIYHGLPVNLFKFQKSSGDYLAFLGRVSPEKRVDRAIEIARLSGLKLLVAAKIDKADQLYFEHVIQPLLVTNQSSVEFIGEIGDDEKNKFLGNAKALLFPIDWPEPFGLVMIESFACGTPVIAYNCGSTPEIIDHGKTGFVVSDQMEAVRMVERINEIDRSTCREVFEKRFTSERMVDDYLRCYERIIAEKKS